ncbi:MAG: ParB N-terminal domain-containing protein [Arcobacteraceae bacterium]|nr:ParB N-terminal domain-containing protein [Arcobacteraceae bacterium]
MAKIKKSLSTSVEIAITEQEKRAKEQIASIDTIKNQIEVESSKPSNIVLIDISLIDEIQYSNGEQMHNRTGLIGADLVKLEELANNIKLNKPNGLLNTGLIQPIIVREVGERYERIVGFRRIEAFKLNNDREIPAVIINCDDKTARLLRNSENQDRVDLNIYDKLYADLETVRLYGDFDSIDGVKLFLAKLVKHNKGEFEFTIEDENLSYIVNEILQSKLNSVSPRTLLDKIAIFNYKDTIKTPLIQNKITQTMAKIISSVKLEDIKIKEIVDFAIETQPTKDELKIFIDNLSPKDDEPTKKISNLKTIQNLTTALKQKNINMLSEDDKIVVNNQLLQVKELLKSVSLKLSK